MIKFFRAMKIGFAVGLAGGLVGGLVLTAVVEIANGADLTSLEAMNDQ
ncbi:hypothetical protein [Blastomonas sp. CCH5-A3]|jgi:hypothetical protein|nr:hypothetical protein [Blastomonas sp. CCH5-A3]|tara:strand:- start:108367 stop:108510 length:144 start_codon:yes stop_codon:yes gene_type:complete